MQTGQLKGWQKKIAPHILTYPTCKNVMGMYDKQSLIKCCKIELYYERYSCAGRVVRQVCTSLTTPLCLTSAVGLKTRKRYVDKVLYQPFKRLLRVV